MSDWIVATTKSGAMGFECQRCGRTYEPTMPVEVSMLLATSNAFVEKHKNCKEKKP